MSNEIDPTALIQQVNLSDDDLKFQTPAAICISGPSQCGKSSFIVKLIQNRDKLFNQTFTRLYYCQPANLCIRSNPIFDEICQSYPLAELICGLPNISKLGF